MIIAVAYDKGQIFNHFGKSPSFKLYETANGKIISERIIWNTCQGHSAIGELIKANDVSVLICGGICSGARSALKELDIEVYGGINGNADRAVQDYLNGILPHNENVECHHN